MQINGPGHVHGPQSIQSAHRAQPTEPTSPDVDSFMEADQVDISQQADLVSRVREMPDIRADRVAQIRAEIQSGSYETLDKLDVALDRLLQEIGS